MKELLKILFMVAIVVVCFIYREAISNFILDNFIYRDSNKVITYNEYYLENNYGYVQNTDTTDVESYQEVLNIFYTVINSGDTNFSFNCKYDSCIDDVKTIMNDENIVGTINNFVHPYNSYSSINIDVSNSGKVTIKTKKMYSEKEIEDINEYVDSFISTNINDGMTNYEKIKKFHDYIIDNTVYDKDNIKESYTAYDLITTGKSICGGYSDIMSIYLNKLGIKNYRITSENHVWNLVYLDDVWYHLDLTWDDPVASDGNQYLLHNFFLISTQQLHNLDKVEHTFDTNIYKEAN